MKIKTVFGPPFYFFCCFLFVFGRAFHFFIHVAGGNL